MDYTLKDGRQVRVRPFASIDFENLIRFYSSLNSLTRSRFAPHSFERNALGEFYSKSADVVGYIAEDQNFNIVGYSVCKLGFFDYDLSRFQLYGFTLSLQLDCFYAPSIAEDWQGYGVGNCLFEFVKKEMQYRGYKRIFLWGGVQVSNINALCFYERLGFQIVGEFEYNGLNRDMVLTI